MVIEHFPLIKNITQKLQLSRTFYLKGYGAAFWLFVKIAAAHDAAPLRQQYNSPYSSPLQYLSIRQSHLDVSH